MIEKTLWGTSPCGKEILKYKITNASGAYVELSSVGAGIVSAVVPDKDGKMADVVLGYPKAESYFGDGPCFGKVPGRYANRIALGKFILDRKEYTLPINNGPNHLHGGPDGFQNQVWDSRIDGDAVEFQYVAADGEMGYPGCVKAIVRYDWSEDNALRLTFTAVCDAPTVINLTNHVYFNLNGEGSGDIFDHVLRLNASEYLPTTDSLIPLGDSESVIGTPGQLQKAAELNSPQSGRSVTVLTTQPGVQIYTGNWLEGCPTGKCGRSYHDYEGVAIECQNFPDAINHPDYPSPILRPGDTYQQAIIFAFGVK